MVDVQRLVFAQPYWPAFSSGAVDFIPLLDGCLHVRRRAARIRADGFTAPVYFIFDEKI